LKEQMFECGSADSYNVCEWASIDRLERGKRGGSIAALRAAVAAQAILTFDEKLQTRATSPTFPWWCRSSPLALHDTPDAGERRGARARQDQNGSLPSKRWEGLRDALTVRWP